MLSRKVLYNLSRMGNDTERFHLITSYAIQEKLRMVDIAKDYELFSVTPEIRSKYGVINKNGALTRRTQTSTKVETLIIEEAETFQNHQGNKNVKLA